MDETRHIYLYAKYWYKRSSDTFADIAKILAHICAVDQVSRKDVYDTILPLVYKYIEEGGNPEHHFTEFVKRFAFSSYDDNRKIETCLAYLANEIISDNLGEPDPNILPLAA